MPDGGSIHERSASILQFGKATLEVSVIADFEDFLALKSGWQALEALDPHYTVFLSWAWLERTFRDNPEAWRLVVVRDPARGPDPVCILPLQVKTGWSGQKGAFCTLLGPGGQLIWSEYAGWLCHPDYDPDAIRLTGAALKQMTWLHFEMRHEASNDRLRSFATAFETDARFTVAFPEHRVAKDAVAPGPAIGWIFSTPTRPSATESLRARPARRCGRCGGVTSCGGVARDLLGCGDGASRSRHPIGAWGAELGAGEGRG